MRHERLAGRRLDELAGRMLGELSVGQFRRALFARVIVQDAAIVLLDEPFAGVDAATSDELLRLMQRWHAEGRTVMVALHDLEQVLAIFPATLLLMRKAIAWGETATALTHGEARQGRSGCATQGARSAIAAGNAVLRAAGRHEPLVHPRCSLRRIRLHAVRTGRLHGACGCQRSTGHAASAAANGPSRRRPLACSNAGRRDCFRPSG